MTRHPASGDPSLDSDPDSFAYPEYSRSNADRMDLPKILQPYLRRIWLIVLLALIGGVAAGLWAYRLPNEYAAVSTLYIAKQPSQVLAIEGVVQERQDEGAMLNTIVQSVTRSAVLRRVVSSNRLTQDARFVPSPGGNLTEDQAVGRLRDLLKVQLRPNTLLVDITARSTNAALSALLANAVARAYIAERSEGAIRSTESGSDLLVEELKRLETKLQDSERRLLAFREKNQVSSIETERQSLEIMASKIKADLVANRDQMETQAASRKLVAEAAGQTAELLAIPFIAKTPAVATVSQQIVQQQVILDGYTNRYRAQHPKFTTARQHLASLERSLEKEIAAAILTMERSLPVLQSTEKTLNQELVKVENKIQDLNRLSAEYSVLDREVTADTALQQSVLKRIKELEITKQVDNIPVTVSETAPELGWLSGPPRPRFIATGALLGLALAVGMIFFLEKSDASLRTVDEAEDRLQLPVLGAISVDPGSQERNQPRLVMVDEAHGLTAEGFRSLRASTAMIGRAENIRVRMLTSALPSEGKSFCALNYAAALAQLGQSVVLVDLDLRRPTVGQRLGLPEETPGVSSFLLGQASLA
ncbi:MAG: hypothetical protein KIT22_14080, partial [Verrucomicrobiae bacterium]|nr:hypothetical protein [Verrucomicrobiae bacterium]